MSPTKKQQRPQASSSRTPVKVALRPWWQSPGFLGGGSATLVVVLVVVLVLATRGGASATSNALVPVPASVLSAVEDPSASVLVTVGAGGMQTGELKRIPGTPILRDSSGKVDVVYVGAEYCPYCAAERWVMTMALSRFGTFKNLKEMTSSSTDIYPDTDTFTYVDASYSSQWVDFQPNEIEDRSEQPLQTPDSQDAQLFATYDKAPYTAQTLAFPFLDIANQFSLYETGYDPGGLQGLSWQQIASDLSDPSNPVTQAIVGNANITTAAICIATGNQPASVCSSPTIRGIETTLDALPAA